MGVVIDNSNIVIKNMGMLRDHGHDTFSKNFKSIMSRLCLETFLQNLES